MDEHDAPPSREDDPVEAEEEAFATRARAFFFDLDRGSNPDGYTMAIPLARPVLRVLPRLVARAKERAREVAHGRPSPSFPPWEDAGVVEAIRGLSAFQLGLYAKHFPRAGGAEIDAAEVERAHELFARGRLRKVQLATNGEPDSSNLLLFAEFALLVNEHAASGLQADAARWSALVPGLVRAQSFFVVAYEPAVSARTWQSWGAGRWKVDPSEHPRATWDRVRAEAEERYRRALAETQGDALAACRAVLGENAAHLLADEVREAVQETGSL